MKKISMTVLLIILVGTGQWGIHTDIFNVIASDTYARQLFLKPFARFKSSLIRESSGIIKSRARNIFWTINDSGNDAVIFPVDQLGRIVCAAGRKGNGLLISGARNIDWEDIAADNNGNIYISDTGNNYSRRKDLAVYIIREPHPCMKEKPVVLKKINVFYPEQARDRRMNFDGEGLFWTGEKLYILTKHRDDSHTDLYRFDSMDEGKSNPLNRIGTYDIGDMVTAADASPDGSKIAVLTYTAAWIFHKPEGSDNYLNGTAYRRPLLAKQCEGICFDGDSLVISNESGEMFRINIRSFTRVRE